MIMKDLSAEPIQTGPEQDCLTEQNEETEDPFRSDVREFRTRAPACLDGLCG